ncbi:MFS transporter [Chitinimonas naiadis]
MKLESLALPAGSAGLSRGMIALFAFCCGAIVANIYYAQPIIALIAPDVGLSASTAGLVVSLTQIGYAAGLFLLVPLGDLLENRRLMITTAAVSILALGAASFAHGGSAFLLVSLLIGISSVSVQMLIPLAAHMSPAASRGSVVGSIMSGLLMGILLARPISSFVADHWGWRTVFSGAAVLMVLITLALAWLLPERQPDHKASYASLLRSLIGFVVNMPVLRERSLYQASLFAAFSLFWTAVPMELMHHYQFSQSGVALFALVGAIGAVAAPISGRLADKGYTRVATMAALALGVLSFLPNVLLPGLGAMGLVLTGVVLDFAVQMNLVLGQREIYALDPQSRSRLNAVYMTSIFLGGALGSGLAGVLYAQGGWLWIALAGSAFALMALGRNIEVSSRG